MRSWWIQLRFVLDRWVRLHLYLTLCLTLLLNFFTPLAQGVSPIGVPILVYHRFGPAAVDTMTVTTPVFVSHLRYLKENGYTVIPLKQFVDFHRDRGSLPPRSVVLTVDDTHRTVYTEMFPLIKQYHIPVTQFVYPSAVANAPYAMTWEQLQELQERGLFDIQSHTYWHPNFHREKKRLSPLVYEKLVDQQFTQAKDILQHHLGVHIDLLAWPFGIYDDDLIRKAVAVGYRTAFTIERRPARLSDHSMVLPRYLMTDSDRGTRFAQMLLNDGGANGRQILQSQTIRQMTSPQSFLNNARGRGFGWDPETPLSSSGVYGHTGFTGTSLWIDPPSRTYVIILTNRVHPHGRGEVKGLRTQVATTVAAAFRPQSADMMLAYNVSDSKERAGDSQQSMTRLAVTSGIDVLVAEQFAPLARLRVGLITNHTGRDATWYDDTGLPWISPSPNLPSLTAATLYPGAALMEGANISVGRGTDIPFEIFGAPWLAQRKLVTYLNARNIPGVRFVPRDFIPRASCYAQRLCHGVQIVLLDRQLLDAPALGIEIVSALYHLYPNVFELQKTLGLIGARWVLQAIKEGDSPSAIAQRWQVELDEFRSRRAAYLLY